MKLDTKCPVCQRLDGDGGHLFLKCKLARHVWRELKLEREWENLNDLVNARDVIEQILKEKEDRRLLMFITFWFLWTERNIVREEGCRRSAETITRAIQIYAGEWGLGRNKYFPEEGSGAPGATLGNAF
jgi:hypothetical protein